MRKLLVRIKMAITRKIRQLRIQAGNICLFIERCTKSDILPLLNKPKRTMMPNVMFELNTKSTIGRVSQTGDHEMITCFRLSDFILG